MEIESSKLECFVYPWLVLKPEQQKALLWYHFSAFDREKPPFAQPIIAPLDERAAPAFQQFPKLTNEEQDKVYREWLLPTLQTASPQSISPENSTEPPATRPAETPVSFRFLNIASLSTKDVLICAASELHRQGLKGVRVSDLKEFLKAAASRVTNNEAGALVEMSEGANPLFTMLEKGMGRRGVTVALTSQGEAAAAKIRQEHAGNHHAAPARK